MGASAAKSSELPRQSLPAGIALFRCPPHCTGHAHGGQREHSRRKFGGSREPRRSCIAALHKMCLRIAQLLATRATAGAHDGFLPFPSRQLFLWRFQPSHLKGLGFPMALFFWRYHYLRHCAQSGAKLQPSDFRGHFCLAESTPPDRSLTFASLLRASVRAKSSKPRP